MNSGNDRSIGRSTIDGHLQEKEEKEVVAKPWTTSTKPCHVPAGAPLLRQAQKKGRDARRRAAASLLLFCLCSVPF